MVFRPCEFRRFTLRRSESEWVCDAAGVPLADLALAGESLEQTCARCPIPDEMARRPCLFMTPVKLQHDDEWKELFACHWYHTITRDWALRDTRQCLGCTAWFPRPPRRAHYRLLERTAAMRDTMLRRLTEPPPATPTPRWEPPPRPWWRRVVEWALRAA